MEIDANDICPFVTFDGSNAREIGHQHGTVLADRIDQAVKIYRKLFAEKKADSEKFIWNLSQDFYRGIQSFSQDYIEEINSIAVASKQDPLWIIALNSRLEILNMLNAGIQNECTVVYDRATCHLAENWDWIENFENLIFVNSIPSKGILQMTEPGILGKVGLNSSGIGVTINFVDPPYKSKEYAHIPLHILLRAVLEQARTFDDALSIFKRNGPGYGGHTLVGDDQGNCCSIEFPGDQVQFLHNHTYHTNHFLSVNVDTSLIEPSRYQNSFHRYDRMTELTNQHHSLESILFDQNETQKYPICRSYKPSSIGNVGTVCSIIMDLKSRIFKMTKGNPLQNRTFQQYKLTNP